MANAHRIFTGAQVEAIRLRYAKGEESQLEIALDLGVEGATVGFIVRGETYPEAPGPIIRRGKGYKKLGHKGYHRVMGETRRERQRRTT